jgi:glycosyltransferase involved in cell wall biosynthesis
LEAIFQFLFWLLGSTFLVVGLSAWSNLRWAQRLPKLAVGAGEVSSFQGSVFRWKGDEQNGGQASKVPLPKVSVVLAARDEEARIEHTVRRLLAQRGVDLEIVVVDDRSTDRTGEILKNLAREDGRVRYLRVDVLPPGWLGKCHACHLGASAAKNEWILFTDADCWMQEELVARALTVAAREGADHVTLTPGVMPETIAARAWHLAFLFSLVNWFSGVNRDRPGSHLGIGAFNLMRVEAYRACGGYEALRLTVVDDVRLGLLLHRSGRRTRAYIGGDDVECHWGNTVPNMIRIMEKNYFAVLNYRTFTVVALLAVAVPGWTLAFLGPFTGTPAGWTAGLGLFSLALPAAILAGRLGWPRWHACLMPYVMPALYYAVVRSAVITLWRGGVRWRDTFYSLEELRKGHVK